MAKKISGNKILEKKNNYNTIQLRSEYYKSFKP